LRLVRRLAASRDAAVLIHHDPSKPPLDAASLADLSNVGFVERPIPIRWGRFSQVRAVLTGIETALRRCIPFSWVVLLSGQDYPCTPVGTFERWLEASTVEGYLNHEPLAFRRNENVGRSHFRYYEVPPAWRPLTRRLWRLNGLQPFVRFNTSRVGSYIGIFDKRPFTAKDPCWRGSFWWTLSRPCIEYVHGFVRKNPDYVAAYELKLHPDESFFQSILVNAGCFRFANDDLHYVRWDDSSTGSPAVLRVRDVPAIVRSEKPFARKLDALVDGDVFDEIERAVDARATLIRAERSVDHRAGNGAFENPERHGD
jgi:hypothetical protein